MKKHLLSMALGLMMSAGAFAQVEFVDAGGNVIPNGSTVVRNQIEKPVPVLEMYQINSGISVKNTSSSAVSVKSQLDSEDLPFGQLGLCFPGSCWINLGDFKGSYPTHKPVQANLAADGPWTSSEGTLGAGKTESLQTEWKLNSLGLSTFDPSKDNGSFTATYSLLVGGKTVSTIKVLYSTDPKASTGIAGVKTEVDNKTVVATYNAAGLKVAPGTKGLNIVKYSDGSSKKIVVK